MSCHTADCAFLIENWPVTTDAALAEIGDFRKAYTVRPLPAYDVAGKLIRPYNYKAMLRGAKVKVYFHLKDENTKDLFGTELTNIIVLRAPYTEDSVTPGSGGPYGCHVLAEEAY
ncbi:hypothetical protein PENSPDRAFT_747318 [Peniophora sp. CONT]|nr:hypothetical protein PENSPDRAFT_747318 [Peniophora sp. CONT]